MNKAVLWLIVLLSCVSFFGAMSLRQYYTRNRPETAQIELGRVVAIDANYGKTVYVTRSEKVNMDLTYWSLLLPGVVIIIYWGFLRMRLHQIHARENKANIKQ